MVFSGGSFAQGLFCNFAGYTFHPSLAQLFSLGHQRFGGTDGAVVKALGALDLSQPFFRMIGHLSDIGRGGALALGHRLEFPPLVRAVLFAEKYGTCTIWEPIASPFLPGFR